MAAVLMLLGVVLVAVGAYLYDPRAAVIVAGLELVVAGVDLTRNEAQ